MEGEEMKGKEVTVEKYGEWKSQKVIGKTLKRGSKSENWSSKLRKNADVCLIL